MSISYFFPKEAVDHAGRLTLDSRVSSTVGARPISNVKAEADIDTATQALFQLQLSGLVILHTPTRNAALQRSEHIKV